MKYDPQKHHRRSIRLRGYDYSQPGWYFVTIVTHKRQNIFGRVANGQMVLNDAGEIVKTEWLKTREIRGNIKLDAFVIMPNHIHGIIVIMDNFAGAYCNTPPLHYRHTPLQQHRHAVTPFQSPSKTIGAIVRGFKSAATKQINQIRNTPGMPVWQRNYWDHIIRNERELNRIRNYIINNPKKWNDDRFF